MNQELPLRVGIVGCGNVVLRAHAPALLDHPTSRVVAVADPVRARVDEVLAILELGEQAGFSSHSAMFDQADLDYVLVAVPPSLREPIIEEAFRSGLHVLSEKPMATKPSAGKRLMLAAQNHGLNYGMVHNYLYFSEYVLLREKIAQGIIGAPRHISLNFLGVPDLPGHADYRPQWRHDLREAGGGILMDMIHVLYVAEFLIGAEIQAVSAVIDNLGYPGEPIEDLALIHLYFEGAYASVNLGWGHGPGGVEITGSEGRILAFYEDYSTGPFDKLDQFVVITQDEVQQIPPPESQPNAEPFRQVHQDFAESILAKRESKSPAVVGLRILEAALAAYASAAMGQVVSLPLESGNPIFDQGVKGISELSTWELSPLMRNKILGLGIGEDPES